MKDLGPDGVKLRQDVSLFRDELYVARKKHFWADNIAHWRRSDLECIEYKAEREARHARGDFTEDEDEDDDDDSQCDASWDTGAEPWTDIKASPEEYWDW